MSAYSDLMARRVRQIDRIKRIAKEAMREEAEDMALTDATHSRSTTRKKTKAERAADKARVDAFCEALYILTSEEELMNMTPTAVRMRLGEETVEPLPQSIFISQKRGTEPA